MVSVPSGSGAGGTGSAPGTRPVPDLGCDQLVPSEPALIIDYNAVHFAFVHGLQQSGQAWSITEPFPGDPRILE